MSEPRTDAGQPSTSPAKSPEPSAVPAIPGTPPVSTPVPLPAEQPGTNIAGVQLAQRPRHRGDNFGWPANAAPGKPEGEVDTRP